MTDQTDLAQNEAKSLSVYVEAYANSDFGDGPQYARFTVDEQFAGRLAEFDVLLSDYKLSQVREFASPEMWGPDGVEDDLRLCCGELAASGGDIWFQDTPKHADYSIETRSMQISALLDAFNAGERELYLGNDPEKLRRVVAEDRETESAENAGQAPA